MGFITRMLKGWKDFLLLFFPKRCAVCKRLLRPDEQILCTACSSDIELTGLHGEPGNVVERIFWSKVPIQRAAAWMKYAPGSHGSILIHALKYGGALKLGRQLGSAMARDVMRYGFFKDIDVIVPVPLHLRKERLRGYNQSMELARGVALVTGLPINTTALQRCVNTPTQTRLSASERQENVKNAFVTTRPDEIKGKHLLIIDDVLTTGATITACLQAVTNTPWFEGSHTRLSVLTLALAGTHHNAAEHYRPWNPYEPSLQEVSQGL